MKKLLKIKYLCFLLPLMFIPAIGNSQEFDNAIVVRAGDVFCLVNDDVKEKLGREEMVKLSPKVEYSAERGSMSLYTSNKGNIKIMDPPGLSSTDLDEVKDWIDNIKIMYGNTKYYISQHDIPMYTESIPSHLFSYIEDHPKVQKFQKKCENIYKGITQMLTYVNVRKYMYTSYSRKISFNFKSAINAAWSKELTINMPPPKIAHVILPATYIKTFEDSNIKTSESFDNLEENTQKNILFSVFSQNKLDSIKRFEYDASRR